MKFSFEVPIHSLKHFDKQQDYLFILGHQLTNKTYYDYCKNSNKFKVLDNGGYELGESIPADQLIQYAIEINADVVVIPDKLFDKKRSKQLEKKFFKLYDKQKCSFRLMKVVCGSNIKEYLNSLIEVARDDRVDVIGISQSRSMIAINLSFVMLHLIDGCEGSIDKPIHLLGCSSPFELIEANKWSMFIHTIDTGRPINFAFKNKKLPFLKASGEWVKESGYDIHTKKKLNIKLAKQNIATFKKYYNAID